MKNLLKSTLVVLPIIAQQANITPVNKKAVKVVPTP